MSDLPAGARDIEQVIRETNWDEMMRRLIVYSSRVVAPFGKYAGRIERPEDYAVEAIRRYLQRVRQLRVVDDRSLFYGLCGVVDSLVSHDVDRLARRGVHLPIDTGDAEDDTIAEDHLLANDSGVMSFELSEHLEHFLNSLDPELRAYALARLADEGKTAEEHAAALGVSVAVIRNLDKRLRRRRATWS